MRQKGINVRKIILLLSLSQILLTSCGQKNKFLLAIGGENVPVGQYAQKILRYYEINEEAMAKKELITFGEDVKAVTSQVKEGLVSCGIIYATDAFSANLKVIDTATKDMCGQVIYPAAALNDSAHPDCSVKFLSYLASKEAMDVFASVGFSSVSEVPTTYEEISEEVKLTIFAAASLTETMNKITETYHSKYTNVSFEVVYGSSGKLQTQIEEGAECDLFISAGAKQMNALEDDEYLLDDSCMNLLENKVVLSVPDDNPMEVTSFDVMAKLIKERL